MDGENSQSTERPDETVLEIIPVRESPPEGEAKHAREAREQERAALQKQLRTLDQQLRNTAGNNSRKIDEIERKLARVHHALQALDKEERGPHHKEPHHKK